MTFLLVFFALLSIFWARIVRTQESLAICTDDEYKWASNLPPPHLSVSAGLLTIQFRETTGIRSERRLPLRYGGKRDGDLCGIGYSPVPWNEREIELRDA